MTEQNILLKMKNITKTFGKVTALRDVNLEVKQGEVHALVGENGAHGGNDGRGGKVFRSDQLQTVLLPQQLPVHHGGDFGVITGNEADGINGFSKHNTGSFP